MYELFFWINPFHATGPHGVISGPYFPVFSPNTGKYGPETIPYLDTFHATGLFLDPLKTSKNLFFFCFYGVYKKTSGTKLVNQVLMYIGDRASLTA